MNNQSEQDPKHHIHTADSARTRAQESAPEIKESHTHGHRAEHAAGDVHIDSTAHPEQSGHGDHVSHSADEEHAGHGAHTDHTGHEEMFPCCCRSPSCSIALLCKCGWASPCPPSQAAHGSRRSLL